MALNDARLGWVIAAIIALCSGVIGFGAFSARAGALETRVTTIEQRQAGMDTDMKKVLDGLARIEQKVEDLRK